MAKARVVSTRMTIEDLAKARDGLLAKGISLSNLLSTTESFISAKILKVHQVKNLQTL